MKIVDTFTFYNELKMLEFRLEELHEVVDYFVIVEATYTHSGKEKELYFDKDKELFSKYLDKIIHIIVDDMPNDGNSWNNENHQRRCIHRGIEKLNLNNTDIIIVSDCDEIPDTNVLNKIKKYGINDVYSLVMDMYYYNLCCKGTQWYHSKILNYETYNKLGADCEKIRMLHNTAIKGIKCGWHFSYFGGVEFIKNKIKNFAHQEYNNDNYLDDKKIEQQIKNCDDLFFRNNKDNHNFKRVEICDNDYLPENHHMLLEQIMNIGFWSNQLCERGTEVSMYDYACFNETILGNKSYIFYEINNPNNKSEIISKFRLKFKVFPVKKFDEIDGILVKNSITHLYNIKSGQNDGKISKVSKNCIHCVFDCHQPHGEIYSSIAPWVNGNNCKFPVVPHMINLPKHNENMREKLNIHKNATVFGGYGGRDSFNISFVHKVIFIIAKNNPNIYFLFANFNKFCNTLPNIIHLDMITDVFEKVSLINTCDAMLWARREGETFGLSIAEFSTCNKPVIAMKIGHNPGDYAHVKLLGEKAIWYKDQNDLYKILLTFDPIVESKKDWNAYKEYTPEKVMKIFKEVYLS
jgi:beta-1,4-mannosyl-glycoprotein beta-1,4-N-acetylglucosaminyltransferase